MNGRPTLDEIETALDVLLWLYEVTDDGHARDDVSRVRYMLDNPAWESERQHTHAPWGYAGEWPVDP